MKHFKIGYHFHSQEKLHVVIASSEINCAISIPNILAIDPINIPQTVKGMKAILLCCYVSFFFLQLPFLYDNETRWPQNECKIYCHFIFFFARLFCIFYSVYLW
jgi:hypothetical protein